MVTRVWGLLKYDVGMSREELTDSLITGPIGLVVLIINALRGGTPTL